MIFIGPTHVGHQLPLSGPGVGGVGGGRELQDVSVEGSKTGIIVGSITATIVVTA